MVRVEHSAAARIGTSEAPDVEQDEDVHVGTLGASGLARNILRRA